MSSFFLKGKPRNVVKRKSNKLQEKQSKSKLPKRKYSQNTELNGDSGQESINSEEEEELENINAPDHSESENEYETPEGKKLRLAKAYLEEIAKEEQKRAEHKEFEEDAISKRLRDDYLEQQGKLRKNVADLLKQPSVNDVSALHCKEHRLSLTCLCISSQGEYLFSGSKCATIVKWSLVNFKKIKSITYKTGIKEYPKVCHKSTINALAISSDGKYLASSDDSKLIQIWDPQTLTHLKTFKGHRGKITGLTFRKDSHDLYSASEDRSVKIWSLKEMSYVETMYGHQASITAIDALSRERAITCGGRDATIRIWKIVEESQLVFNGNEGSCIDDVKLIDEEHFVSCCDDGSLSVWNVMKKKPIYSITNAHGLNNEVPRWITSVTALLNSDVIASGSHDGYIRLWKVDEARRKVEPLFEYPVKGFVNSLQFSPDGKLLIAAVGQEHKMARWWKEKDAKNSIVIIKLNYNS